MATRFALLTATLLTLALVSARSASAAPAAGTRLVVDSIGGQPHAGKPELWTGTVLRDGPRAPEVPECIAVSCDRVQVKVDLPELLWRIRSGGVQIAIRFINGTPDDNLALAVYRNGHRIGTSTAQVGTAQSVVIPEAPNGTYQVYVVDGLAFGNPEPSPSIAYEGLAQVVYDPLVHPVRDLLPDLVALPQQNVTFGPPFDIFNDPVPPGSTCHQSEIDEDHAHTCLRFDQVLGNIGKGALDIRFSQPAGVASGRRSGGADDPAHLPLERHVLGRSGGQRALARDPPALSLRRLCAVELVEDQLTRPARRQRADRDRQQGLVLHRDDQHQSRLLGSARLRCRRVSGSRLSRAGLDQRRPRSFQAGHVRRLDRRIQLVPAGPVRRRSPGFPTATTSWTRPSIQPAA